MDPNLRPAFMSEKHRLFLRGLMESVTVLKLSDEEVDLLGDTSHVPVVVTTMGGNGIQVRAPFGTVEVAAPAVDVADTIGAGDTVMAALVHQFDTRGLDRGAACTRRGRMARHPRLRRPRRGDHRLAHGCGHAVLARAGVDDSRPRRIV
nr:PfkB family carbohydrate kinase [Corynebacterium lujinxingii]